MFVCLFKNRFLFICLFKYWKINYPSSSAASSSSSCLSDSFGFKKEKPKNYIAFKRAYHNTHTYFLFICFFSFYLIFKILCHSHFDRTYTYICCQESLFEIFSYFFKTKYLHWTKNNSSIIITYIYWYSIQI